MIPSLLILGVVGVSLLFQVQGTAKAKALVQQWATDNGWMVIEVRRLMFGGRFWWRTSKSQRVYRVTLTDRAGGRGIADVRCGSWVLGMMSPEIKVEWVESHLAPGQGSTISPV